MAERIRRVNNLSLCLGCVPPVAQRLRDTALIIFDGLAGRRSLLAFATRIMAMTPHRDSDSDGLTTIHDIGSGRLEPSVCASSSSRPNPA